MPEYKSPQSEPGMDKNLLLIFLVMAVAIFGAQFFMRKYAPQQTSSAKPAQQPIQSGAPSTPETSPVQQSATAPAQKAPGSKAPAAQPVSKQAASESETVIENGLYRITFTNRGAQVKSWVLKQFNDDQGKPLDLVNSAAAAKQGYPLSLWTYDEGLRNTLNSALYVPSTTETLLEAPAQIAFEYSDGSLTVRKSFHFDHSYVVSVETSVFSNGSPVYAFPAWPSGFGDQTNVPAYESAEFEYQVNDKTEHINVKKISGGNTAHGSYNWVGISDSYFAAAFIPDRPEDLSVISLHYGLDIPDPSKPDQTRPVDLIGIAAGHPGQTSTRLFAGPKSVQVLESISVPTISGAERDLRSIVNFGFFGVIARPLFIWLRWTNQYVNNWGWSIVLQTLIITLALAPLTVYQMKSAIKMQKVQPQMKAIQEKYKKYSMKDPRKQEMNKEIADLYKAHNVNPVGGCLPLLIQLPFLYAYYRMLSVAIDLRQAHWLWIHDLSAADPLYILPLLMAGSMFLSQKMTPQVGMDPAQQRMMNVMMPVMMGIFFFKLPAGLNLYYAVSNLIRIGQQAIMNRTELGREMREIAAKRARKRDK
jgi:YidC/Oxa1 family membrane protein insertase